MSHDRALDRAIADYFGDTQVNGGWRDRDGLVHLTSDGGPPFYSADPGAAQLLENEVERRGLDAAYVVALCGVVKPKPMEDDSWVFKLIRATPKQKARAFMEAITHAE